jgi:hypothetical protein
MKGSTELPALLSSSEPCRTRRRHPLPVPCSRPLYGGWSQLAFVLRDEVRRGNVDYFPATRRYALNGGLPEDVKQALRDLSL